MCNKVLVTLGALILRIANTNQKPKFLGLDGVCEASKKNFARLVVVYPTF